MIFHLYCVESISRLDYCSYVSEDKTIDDQQRLTSRVVIRKSGRQGTGFGEPFTLDARRCQQLLTSPPSPNRIKLPGTQDDVRITQRRLESPQG